MNVRVNVTGFCAALLAACASDAQEELPQGCAVDEIALRTEVGWACARLAVPDVNALATASLSCAQGEVAVFGAGKWSCGAPASAAGGDITEVRTRAGSGLTGGAASGVADLAVRFGSDGVATEAARADHGHGFSSLVGLPGGFADLVDDDALGALQCRDGEVAAFDAVAGGWRCHRLSPGQGGEETDPTVNDLARASALDTCLDGEVPTVGALGWSCARPADRDTLAAVGTCLDGEVLTWSARGWRCGTSSTTGPALAAGTGLIDTGTHLEVDFGGACASGTAACNEHAHPELMQDLTSVLGRGASANGHRLEDVAPPVLPGDVATKAYVDAMSTGGAAGMSVAICCGATCASDLSTWNCDDVAMNGSMSVPVADKGMVWVPDTGAPRLYAATGETRTLQACGAQWFVCTKAGLTHLVASCGAFSPSSAPSPYRCGVPATSYFFVPGVSGVLFFDGADVDNELLTRTATSYSPPARVDCSAATPLPGSLGARTAVCWR